MMYLFIDDDIKQLKKKFGFSPDEKYVVPQSVSAVTIIINLDTRTLVVCACVY